MLAETRPFPLVGYQLPPLSSAFAAVAVVASILPKVVQALSWVALVVGQPALCSQEMAHGELTITLRCMGIIKGSDGGHDGAQLHTRFMGGGWNFGHVGGAMLGVASYATDLVRHSQIHMFGQVGFLVAFAGLASTLGHMVAYWDVRMAQILTYLDMSGLGYPG
jgi:hypothetical protein